MDAETSIQNAMFQFMIGNTDFSVAYQHNGKLLFVNKEIIPLPYDFDMTGWVNPSYATVNQSLGIKSVRERVYRGFKREEQYFDQVREDFIAKKTTSDEADIIKVLKNVNGETIETAANVLSRVTSTTDGALINLGGGNTILLEGVNSDSLTAANFAVVEVL